ncbi:MAG: hypothetical protein JOZ81_30270 [Chloroflexi bacterium]|nr:hypothetical protein [Chloroflexota bacterium]MBV9547132.1 hypothetical protein [Chloroflexota bacterium]
MEAAVSRDERPSPERASALDSAGVLTFTLGDQTRGEKVCAESVAQLRGDLDSAQTWLNKATILFQHTGDPDGRVFVRESLAGVLLSRDRAEEALELLYRTASELIEIGDLFAIGSLFALAACAEAMLGRGKRAARALGLAAPCASPKPSLNWCVKIETGWTTKRLLG